MFRPVPPTCKCILLVFSLYHQRFSMRCESSDNPLFSGQEVSKQSSKRSSLSGMSLTFFFFKEFAIYTIHNHINLIWMKYFAWNCLIHQIFSNYCHKLYVFTLLPFLFPLVSVISLPLHFKQCFFIPLLLYWLVLPKFVNFVSFPHPPQKQLLGLLVLSKIGSCFYFIKFLFILSILILSLGLLSYFYNLSGWLPRSLICFFHSFNVQLNL